MEISEDAMLDRIRQVEDDIKEVKQGGYVKVVEAGGAATAQTAIPAAEKPKLEKAVPEEIREVVRNWMGIVGNAQNPMKTYLKGAKLSLGAGNELVVALADGLPYDYFKNDEGNVEACERLIADFCGKEVKVSLSSFADANDFDNHFVDLSKVIQMEIEEEE